MIFHIFFMTEELKNWHAPCGIYCKRCPGVQAYNCKGCRTLEGQILDFPVCKTFQCITEKGHEFCFECNDFPCEKLQTIVNFEIFAPHNSKIYNLLMIQKLGVSKWDKICEEKSDLYYKGKKVKYGGDPLTLEEKDTNFYKKKE